MIIKEVIVQNFRSILNERIECEELTVLVGANGAGKSSFLHALNLFYILGAKLTEHDFYNRDTTVPIIIIVRYAELTPSEKELFSPYLDGEELTIQKEIAWPGGKGYERYYGSRLQIPDFVEIRRIPGAREQRTRYEELVESGRYSGLKEKISKATEIEPEFAKYEQEHPELCKRQRDEGQFFGFKEVGSSRLERFTRFLFIPAVRDASEDAIEGRGKIFTELMDLVVRSALVQKKELLKLKEEAQAKYDEVMNPDNLPELPVLQNALTETLKTYVPDAAIKLLWQKGESIELPLPRSDIRLIEDGFPSDVERSGHGLQRAFIMTLLQHLTVAQSRASSTPEIESEIQKDLFHLPNLIIGIEEPELYQHPSRQRHLCKIFFQLAKGDIRGVVDRTQIIYSTHSPLLVSLENFDKIRLLKKINNKTRPKITNVYRTSLTKVANRLQNIYAPGSFTYTNETLKQRLQTLMTPWMNEGFFADVVVLVEGECDRSAIIGAALAKDKKYDFDSLGISVIPCMGKNNIDRPYLIFNNFQIPVYIVFDGDYQSQGAKPEDNHKLLKLLGDKKEDWPEKVTERYACFKVDIEKQIENEIGKKLFDSLLDKFQQEFNFRKREEILKCPNFVASVLIEAKKEGKICKTLDLIVENIVKLKGK